MAVSVLGLAVPVTASFVISWVIVGPALQDLGVAAPAAAMFVFYFAVLSEVTPPTALASVAASAITGGKVIATMWQTWKYTLPAFLVPFAFVLTDNGEGLLGLRSSVDMVWTTAVVALAVAALAVVTGGWMIRRAGWPERVLCAPAAALLLYLNPIDDRRRSRAACGRNGLAPRYRRYGRSSHRPAPRSGICGNTCTVEIIVLGH